MMCGERMPLPPTGLPMMSMFRTPWMFQPAALANCAKWAEPYRPCSSPANATNLIVASVGRFASTRASSSTADVPDASSLAPGASLVAFMTSVTRES